MLRRSQRHIDRKRKVAVDLAVVSAIFSCHLGMGGNGLHRDQGKGNDRDPQQDDLPRSTSHLVFSHLRR
jgi:hypothetical protein